MVSGLKTGLAVPATSPTVMENSASALEGTSEFGISVKDYKIQAKMELPSHVTWAINRAWQAEASRMWVQVVSITSVGSELSVGVSGS